MDYGNRIDVIKGKKRTKKSFIEWAIPSD